MGAADDDEYAKKYMEGGGALATSRMRMGPLLFIFMGVAALSVLVTAVATGLYGLLPMMLAHAFITLTMSHLRVTVTRELVHIQYGLFGPKIPVARIEAARAVPYDWKRYGGWGLRRSFRGTDTAYSVTGGRKMGIELDVRSDDGKLQTVFASSDEPEELVRAVEQATGKRFAPAPAHSGVRVEPEVATAAEVAPSEGAEAEVAHSVSENTDETKSRA